MYRRSTYVGVLAVTIAGLEISAAFGTPPQPLIAYVLAVVLGGIVFYQADAPVTASSVFGNVFLAAGIGTGASVVVIGGLLMYVLALPPAFTFWQAGVLLWDSWAGILTATLAGFFLTALVGAFAS